MNAGSNGSDDPPPPKPSRYPHSCDGSTSNSSQSSSAVEHTGVSTYIVAQNPEVLVHLLKENESRGLNPSVYTTPASAFNTLAVDFKTLQPDGSNGAMSACNSTQSLNNELGDSEDHQSFNTVNTASCTSTLPRNFGGRGGGKGVGRQVAGSSGDLECSDEVAVAPDGVKVITE